ncbi:MAG: sigma-70 family RNA polymerase sigma factor [Acidobacteria bacterium]|jgi:RNA polymerase sigma-70 factor (ECF subfamily)|nr:MAG: sigma-70 family RNA polymerase sigma factor [Acidobacteriota bacterium]GIU82839.1 MAG: RNA polymerase sigma factor [Pyrinomonadaceae bacterium]
MTPSETILLDERSLAKDIAFAETQQVDAEFLEKLKLGDTEAFDSLVVLYINDVYRLLLRLSADEEEARDLTQETFLRALKAIKKFRGESNLKTWLFRIAINTSHSRFRWWEKRGLHLTISLDSNDENQKEVLGNRLKSTEFENPEEELLRKEKEGLLLEALSLLPKKFRDAVVLRDIEGFSYEEIAEILQTNIGTVKSRIARGRSELKKKLSELDI